MANLIDGFVDFENVGTAALDGGIAGAVGANGDVLDGKFPGELPQRTRSSNPET